MSITLYKHHLGAYNSVMAMLDIGRADGYAQTDRYGVELCAGT